MGVAKKHSGMYKVFIVKHLPNNNGGIETLYINKKFKKYEKAFQYYRKELADWYTSGGNYRGMFEVRGLDDEILSLTWV